jgi:hypothetical protein
MQNNFVTIAFLFILLSASSCSLLKNDEEKPVAKVFDKYLFKSEISEFIPDGTSFEDSIAMAESYINSWIKSTLLYHQAESNLTDDQKDFAKKLEDYRKSLVIYTYEQKLIEQRLEVEVTDEQIESYYNENKKNFELKDNIAKVIYVKVNKNAPNIEKVRKWYKSNNQEDIIALEGYAYQFAENFYFDSETWLLFEDLIKEIPIKTYNQEDFLKNNRFVELEDSDYYYFVNIIGFKIKNSISPLNFEKDNIRKILLNRRKLQLINKMKNDIYNEALQNSNIEIF